jgi:hypothetical protein
MNQIEFLKQLRATANELTPLAQSTTVGALTWNGTEYVKSDESKRPDPYALSWQTMLRAIADLIEAQNSPLTEKQIDYLEHLLFGGMGSLNDLSFDPKSCGDVAKKVNDLLDKQRRALYASFKDD